MTTGETVLIVIAFVLVFLVIGNVVFSKLAERRNRRLGCSPNVMAYVSTTLSAA
jgi:hypothetical protein